jgi:hypothetical protein
MALWVCCLRKLGQDSASAFAVFAVFASFAVKASS